MDAVSQCRPFIGGVSVKSSGITFPSINPSTEEVIAEVSAAGPTEVDLAVRTASEAQEGSWAQFSPAKRQESLWNLGQLLSEHSDELAHLEVMDTGKTLYDAKKIELPFASQVFKYFAGFCTKINGFTTQTPNSVQMTLREPVGVCGIIVPWNFPLLLACWKVAPALAAGNTVVLKPSELSPLSAVKLAQLAQKAGIPDGVLNVIPGDSQTGKMLVNHPGINKIAFTGSGKAGRDVMRSCAQTLKRLTLELGGKSPNIIFDDADLAKAIKGALSGIFYNKGEVCAAGSRVFVQSTVYDQVVHELTRLMNNFTLGMPLERSTQMGPVISHQQMTRVLEYIKIGQEQGARLVAGGQRAIRINEGKGYFVEPTIFADVKQKMTIAQEEIFGPVLSIIKFESEEDVVAQANDTLYGLAAGVWTQDLKKALRMVRSLKAGTVWVNTFNLFDPALPFGGFKESGIGRDLGAEALQHYTETKSVWIDV